MTFSAKTILIWSMLCCNLHGSAQQTQPQSRLHAAQLLRKPAADTTIQKLCNYIARSYMAQADHDRRSLDSAFVFLRRSVHLIDSSNVQNNPITNESLSLLAEAFFRAGDRPTGNALFDQVIRSYHRTHNERAEAESWFKKGYWLLKAERDLHEVDSSFAISIGMYRQLKDSSNIIRVGLEHAYFHFRIGQVALAEIELLALVKNAISYKSFMLPVAYCHLSVLKRYAGNNDQGLRYALNAERTIVQTGDSSYINHVHGELALEYQELDKPKESVQWYKRCIEERLRINAGQYEIYRTIYLMVVQMLKTGEALPALSFVKQMARDNPPENSMVRGVLHQTLAYCYNYLHQSVLAEKHFLEMERYNGMQPMNGEVMFIAFSDLARFYIEKKNFRLAGSYLAKGLQLIGAPPLSGLKDWHLMKFKVDSADKKFESAILHYQEYKKLTDSIFNDKTRKQLDELIINYQVEKKDNDLRIFEKENKVQHAELKQASQARNWLIAGGVLMLIIILLLIHNSRIKIHSNRILTIQKQEITRQNTSLQQLVSEKDWLVKEIHHRVKNNFHMVMSLLGTQSGYLQSQEAVAALADSRHRIQAMSFIHQKLYQSDTLSAVGIGSYIHELVDYLKESFGTRQSIHFLLEVDPIELDLTCCIPLGLIMNEAITNAIKYAFPDKRDAVIRLSLRKINDNRLQLLIKDNGVGLPATTALGVPSTMGMRLMQGLADDLEATFAISTNAGTELLMEFDMVSGTRGETVGPNNLTTAL